MKTYPISIVITSYNYARYLSTAIESVLSQSFGDFELTIIDDASKDESLELIKAYAKKDSRIRVILHQQNRGVAKSVNEGCYASKGTYLHCLSADDYYLPGFLEKKMRFFNEHSHIGICCSDFGYFYEHKRSAIISKKLLEEKTSPVSFAKENIVPIFKKHLFWLPGHTCIFRRDCFLKYGPFEEKFRERMDWFLYHKIALLEGAGYIPETLSLMRFHDDSFSKKQNINKESHRYLLEWLLDKKNKDLAEKFKRSALFNFLFKSMLRECALRKNAWSFYPPLIAKFLRNRWKEFVKPQDTLPFDD